MRPIFYMIRKEFLQIFRTREMIAILFLVPVIQVAVLGFAITNEAKHIKLIIADHDRSSLSRDIVDLFSHTDRFDIVAYSTDSDDIEERIQSWDAQMALVIPRHFSRDLQRRRQPDIQIIVDALDGNTAGVALGYARQILLGFGLEQSRLALVQQGRPLVHRTVMIERMWYNLNLNSPQYMVPGIVVVLLTIVPMMLSSMSLVREKEIGTLEQLMVTPLKKQQLLFGKLIPFLILSFIEMGIVLQAAQWIFSIEIQGSIFLLMGLAFFYLFTTLGLGIFISTITSTQQQAMFVSWFFMVFMLLMSGLFIPIENMPPALQGLTYLNPMRYFMYIIRDVFQKASTLGYLLGDAIPMAVFGLLIFSFSVLKFRKRVG